MGMSDAFEEIIMGLIFAVILGGFIVGIYPMMSQYFGNSQVFVLGPVVLFIVGILGVIYVYGIVKKALDEIKGGNNNNPFLGG